MELDSTRFWQGDTGTHLFSAFEFCWIAPDFGREIQEAVHHRHQPRRWIAPDFGREIQEAGWKHLHVPRWIAPDFGREIQDWFHKNLQGVGGMANRAGV